MFENLLGRSRAFWQRHFAEFAAAAPEVAAGQDAESIYRAVNRVRPSLIRVEADEVTYNFHIMLRFELELALLEGELSVADLPAAWNAKMQEYLGLTPPSDAEGVLQDIHWSSGLIGYFPTYSLGNLLSVQLLDAARRDAGDRRRNRAGRLRSAARVAARERAPVWPPPHARPDRAGGHRAAAGCRRLREVPVTRSTGTSTASTPELAPERSEVLLIGGRSGVGKTSLAAELHHQLSVRQVKHAVIEGDTLDLAYPPPWATRVGRTEPERPYGATTAPWATAD